MKSKKSQSSVYHTLYNKVKEKSVKVNLQIVILCIIKPNKNMSKSQSSVYHFWIIKSKKSQSKWLFSLSNQNDFTVRLKYPTHEIFYHLSTQTSPSSPSTSHFLHLCSRPLYNGNQKATCLLKQVSQEVKTNIKRRRVLIVLLSDKSNLVTRIVFLVSGMKKKTPEKF